MVIDQWNWHKPSRVKIFACNNGVFSYVFWCFRRFKMSCISMMTDMICSKCMCVYDVLVHLHSIGCCYVYMWCKHTPKNLVHYDFSPSQMSIFDTIITKSTYSHKAIMIIPTTQHTFWSGHDTKSFIRLFHTRNGMPECFFELLSLCWIE